MKNHQQRAERADHLRAVAADVRAQRRRANPSSLISNEIITDALASFLAECYADDGDAVLDLGAGTKPYARLYECCFRRAVSVDVDHSPHDLAKVDAIADAANLPFADREFDCVICTEVLEHCRDPLAVLSEVRRILKPGGRVFLTTPFMIGIHESPHDYFRYTPWGIKELSSRAGFRCHAVEPRGDRIGVTLLFLQYPIAKMLQRMRHLGRGHFYDARNPIVQLLVILPQRLYLAYLRRRHRAAATSRLGRGMRRMEDAPLGYLTHLEAM